MANGGLNRYNILNNFYKLKHTIFKACDRAGNTGFFK